jgi:hypothetical protein
MHIQEPLPSIRRFNKDVSPALERVISKALAKDPEDRFPSVAALNAAYQTALAGGAAAEGQATQVIPASRRAAVGKVQAPPHTGSRLGWAVIAVMAVVVLGLAAAVAWPRLTGGGQATDQPAAVAPSEAPTAAPISAVPPTASPAPTAIPTPIVSATCPGLQLIGFHRNGAEATWTIDNAAEADLYLEGIQNLEWEERNPLTEVRMGGQKILPPEGALIGGDAVFAIPRDERTRVAGRSGKDFTLVFQWADTEPLLSFELTFTGGCELDVP